MAVLCRSLTGHPYSVAITCTTTVRDVRLDLSARLLSPFSDVHLLFRTEVLPDYRQISSLHLGPTDFLVIHTPRIDRRPIIRPVAPDPPIIPALPSDVTPLEAMMATAGPPARRAEARLRPRAVPADLESRVRRVLAALGPSGTRAYAEALLDACNLDAAAAAEWATDEGPMRKREREKKPKAPRTPPPPPEPAPDVRGLARYDFQHGAHYVQAMTIPEKAALLRLLETRQGPSAWEVLQVFMFSDKNFDVANETLRLR
jgi:hypothetical protein